MTARRDRIPRNGELFQGLTDLEKVFINPDATPRDVLTRLDEVFFQEELDKGEDFWKSATWESFDLPCYRQGSEEKGDRDDTKHRHVRPSIQMEIHIRGAWGISCDPGAHLFGPIILGRDVRIRSGAMIVGPAIIGDSVIIGQGCRVTRSIIRDRSEIVFGTRISRCIIGKNVEVCAGAVLNDRFPDRSKALSLAAGDGSWIGAGAVFTTGVFLESGASVADGRHIQRSGWYQNVM